MQVGYYERKLKVKSSLVVNGLTGYFIDLWDAQFVMLKTSIIVCMLISTRSICHQKRVQFAVNSTVPWDKNLKKLVLPNGVRQYCLVTENIHSLLGKPLQEIWNCKLWNRQGRKYRDREIKLYISAWLECFITFTMKLLLLHGWTSCFNCSVMHVVGGILINQIVPQQMEVPHRGTQNTSNPRFRYIYGKGNVFVFAPSNTIINTKSQHLYTV